MIMDLGGSVSDDLPFGLGDRGSRLWREMTASAALTPAHSVLLEEACRIADRLDWLNSIVLRWVSPVNTDDGDGEPKSADIQGLLAESRQQSTALRGLLAEIRQGLKGSASSSPSSGKSGGAGVSDLSAKIAERRRKAQG